MLLIVADLRPKCCVNTEKIKKSGIRGLYLQLWADLVLPSKVKSPVRLSVGCDGRAIGTFGCGNTLHLIILYAKNISRSYVFLRQ